MRIVWISVLLAVGLASYRAASTNEVTQLALAPKDSIVIKQLPSRNITSDNILTLPHVVHLDSIYSNVPLYFEQDGHQYFYVVNGEWNKYPLEDGTDKCLIGIVDENYDTVLPPLYHKIFSPDGIATGYIEIQMDGKIGLLNYRTRQVTPTTFDVIFPSKTLGVVAIGKRGNEYFNILPNCTDQLITNKALYPTYLNILRAYEYTITDKTLLHYINKHQTANSDDKEQTTYYSFEGGVVMPPSYIIESGLTSPWIEGIGTSESYRAFTTSEAYNNIVDTKIMQQGSISILISDFYRKGISSRNGGFEHTETMLAAIDTTNNVTGTASLYVISAQGKKKSIPKENNYYKFIGDSLVEVCFINCDIFGVDEVLPYNCITSYKYLELRPNGELIPSSENRFFPSTKYVYLNEKYFKGSFIFLKQRSKQKIAWPEDENVGVYIADHLSAEDLDLMYNEILADYGYKFKEAKWDKFFRAQDWYKPRFDNVDDKLNPYERANLKLIKASRDKVARNPKKYIHGQFKGYR